MPRLVGHMLGLFPGLQGESSHQAQVALGNGRRKGETVGGPRKEGVEVTALGEDPQMSRLSVTTEWPQAAVVPPRSSVSSSGYSHCFHNMMFLTSRPIAQDEEMEARCRTLLGVTWLGREEPRHKPRLSPSPAIVLPILKGPAKHRPTCSLMVSLK